ncbi:hypothetical protein AHF37_08554 [Paragonimus kellicotti]|nr:hypothetical protein AHF37_08554 [Paragonimus kellicotti]
MLLSFELALRLQQDERLIRPKELAFLVRGNVALAEHSHPPPYPWIPETVWRDLVYLSAFIPRRFGKLIKDIRTMGDQWKKWFEAKNPEVLPYPGRYKKLRPFVRLCLIRCWRMDRISSAITHYVIKVLGKQYVEPPITNLADVLPATSPTIPIVLIVQPGSDPQSQLANLAQQMELGHNRIKYLSMGQGQEPHAESLFVLCAARGNWLLLQNCHLLIRFVPTLEKMLDDLSKPHPDFRLWMTTEMVSNFPIGMLQRSYKVVMEPPSGLKQNLAAGVSKLSHEQFVSCAHAHYPALFIHSDLFARGAPGATSLRQTGMELSLRILQISLAKSEENKSEISWDTIKYLIGEVMYGGRTIDNYDRRILTTYMDEYFGDFLFDNFQPFRFYQDERVEYFIPEEPPGFANYKDLYSEYVSHLPGAHKPEVLGLHPNASIGYSVRFARNMWTNLLLLHSETEVVGGVPTAQRLSQVAAMGLPPQELPFDKRVSMVALSTGQRLSSKSLADLMESVELEHPSESSQDAAGSPSDSDHNGEERGAGTSATGEDRTEVSISDDPNAIDAAIGSGQRRTTSFSVSTKSRSSLTSFTDPAGVAGQTATAFSASSREATIGRLADSLLIRLPPLFDVESLRKKHMGTETSPTIIVLMQELDRLVIELCNFAVDAVLNNSLTNPQLLFGSIRRFNLILAKMLSSLRDLKRALAGKIGMSEELDDVARCLANGLLPASWRRLVPQTEKSLPDWIQHLLRRADQYKKWMSTGKSEPAVMWLSGLHLPQSYLTALIQKACRKHGWALDRCAIQTTMTDIVPEEFHTVLMAPELGCHVCGLYLEGSAWSVKVGCFAMSYQPLQA